MAKIYVIQGPPASGKSTLAKRIHKQNIEHSVIISRDALRESLGTYWVESRENLVRDIELKMIRTALVYGYDVIIDNANMDEIQNKNWILIAELHNAEIEFIQCYLPKEECKIRNKCKDRRPVPDEFIDEFFYKYKNVMKTWKCYEKF